MVVNAPMVQDVLGELEAFVGDSPILGHNIGFDLSFLRRQGLFKTNKSLDSYEMAAVLLPNAGRYGLGALAQALSVPYPATHRALEDAKATRGVFLRLYEEALALPIDTLAELVRLSEPLEWGGYWPLRLALRARTREIVSKQAIQHSYSGPLFNEYGGHPAEPLLPVGDPRPLDIDQVASVLEPGGEFAHHFPNFEHRAQQVEMLRTVAGALSQPHHLLVEAGTGTGKSMAYLIPAALFAIENNRRIVISTNTINLQDQLINKDIPDLRAALGIDLRAVVVKGRSNYLCPRRLESMRKHGPQTPEEMRVLGKTLVWLQHTHTGDRSEINLNGPVERMIFQRISAEDDACTTKSCLKHTGGACPFFRVRQAAQSAHLLIVNHALLLADVATGNRVLPEYDYLIVDEGHHLEDATTSSLSYQVTLADIDRLTNQLGGPKGGILGWLLDATQEIVNPGEFAGLNHLVQRAADLAFRFQNLSKEFFHSLDHFLSEQREGRPIGMYSQQERILEATRTQPAWGEVELTWDEAGARPAAAFRNPGAAGASSG